MLAQRRLTESQLWERLARRGYPDDEIRGAVESCKRDGFVDDALFARLFVDGRVKAVGNARLVAELVRRGIDRDAAKASVATAERDQEERLGSAIDKLFRTRSNLSYPSAARALERLGFPASAIYRQLRERVHAGGWAGAEDEGE
jgi:regulatory protein